MRGGKGGMLSKFAPGVFLFMNMFVVFGILQFVTHVL